MPRIMKRLEPFEKYGSILSEYDISELHNFHLHFFQKGGKLVKPTSKTFDSYIGWKRPLDALSLEYSVHTFLVVYKDPLFSKNTHVLRDEFYSTRYPMFNSATIRAFIKDEINHKKGSMYCVRNVMDKHGLSEEDAKKLIDERKSKTAGNYENFVKRHGDLADEKWSDFKSKSIVSLDNLIEKHGEIIGKAKWENYLGTRDSSSLGYWIEKLGEEQGTKKYNSLLIEFKKGHTLPALIESLGEELGTEKYLKINESKKASTEKLIELHGLKKALEINASKGRSDRQIIEEKGLSAWQRIFKNRHPVYRALKESKIKDPDKHFWDYINKKISLPSVVEPLTFPKKRVGRRSRVKNCVSKQANKYFNDLSELLGRPLQFGSKRNELKLFDPVTCAIRYYDCYDPLTKTVIEWNGSCFHAPENISEADRRSWTSPVSGAAWDDLRSYDLQKIEIAKSHGYNVIVVWDYECNTSAKRLESLKNIVRIINENCVN